MSFQDDVRNTREAVLKDRKYSVPINFLQDRVKAYEMEKTLDEKQANLAKEEQKGEAR